MVTRGKELQNQRIKKDLTGKRFGKWTVIEYYGRDSARHSLWKCKCDCGNEGVRKTSALLSGCSKQCIKCANKQGQLKRKLNHTKPVLESTRINLIFHEPIKKTINNYESIKTALVGKTFGKYTILDCLKPKKDIKVVFKCNKCGYIGNITKHNFFRNKTHHCNCHTNGQTEELIGKRFGKLTVTKIVGKKRYFDKAKSNYKVAIRLLCKCDCGKDYEVYLSNLTSGAITSCLACAKIQKQEQTGFVGQKFGTLTVVKYSYENRKWLLRCDCGNEVYRTMSSLKNVVHKDLLTCGDYTKHLKKTYRKKLEGKRFGKLTVLAYVKRNNQNVYKCQCDCGAISYRASNCLVEGKELCCQKCFKERYKKTS